MPPSPRRGVRIGSQRRAKSKRANSLPPRARRAHSARGAQWWEPQQRAGGSESAGKEVGVDAEDGERCMTRGVRFEPVPVVIMPSS